MMSPRLLRSLRTFTLAGLLAPLAGCTIYVLPELDGESDGSSTGEPGVSAGEPTTGEVPTTGDEPTTGDVPTTGEPVPGDPTAGVDGECDFAGAIEPIFTASCGCHGGGQPAEGLSLAEGSAFAALVGVDSTQVPGTARVQPGDPSASYLIEKLGANPAVGGQMPLGGSLSADQVALISAWIAAGAPASEPFACSGQAAGGEVGEVTIDATRPVVVAVGEIVQVAALVTTPEGDPLADAAVTWTSSGELTLYADGKGALLGISPGTVQLHATAGGVDSPAISVEVVAHDPPPATFTEVRGVTTGACAISGCHVDGVEPGDLRFDRPADKLWEELVEDEAEQVDGLARVQAGAPAESYLIHKLVQRSPAVGGQMPLGAGPMDAERVQVIVRWIVDGAPFN